jgi:hypothetical protein
MQNGTHYYADPNSINQSYLIINFMNLLFKILGEYYHILFYLIDAVNTFIQYTIFNQIWSKKQNVTSTEKNVLVMTLFFNPLALIGTSIKNMGAFKDLLGYLSIYFFLNDD